MKKLIALACLATTVTFASGNALADSIKGRVGVTGKIGFLIPADNDAEFGFGTNHTDAGFIGGGGLIYGIDNHFAAELDLTRSSFGSDTGDFGVTNLSLGGQYRFALPRMRQLVPYVGAGLDILMSDYKRDFDGRKLDVDTTVGAHVTGGVDYFLRDQLALTAEIKTLLAPDTAIYDSGHRNGDFDPSSFSSTFGVRYFFN